MWLPLTLSADSCEALVRLRCSVLRVRVLYLKLRCRSDRRQGRSSAHGRRCVCAISPLRPQEAQHFCPLTSRLRSLPDPAAASVRLQSLCCSVCNKAHSLSLYYFSHALSVTVDARACVSKVSKRSTSRANSRLSTIKYSNNHQLPGFASASPRPDIRLFTRYHGRYHCVDTTAQVELREAYN